MKHLFYAPDKTKRNCSRCGLTAGTGMIAVLLILLFIITGCATLPPIQQEIQTEETYPVLYDAIWEPMSSFFVNRVAPVDTVDKESGILKTKEFSVPYEGFRYRSEYADCGAPGGLYVYRQIIGHFELQVSASEDDHIIVKISPHYRAALWIGNSFQGWVTCESKGYVEKLLFDDLRIKLKDAPKGKARTVAKKDKPSVLTLIGGTVWNIELTPYEEGKKISDISQPLDKDKSSVLTMIDGTVWSIKLTPQEKVGKGPDISQPSEKVKKEPDTFPPEQEIRVKCWHILPRHRDDLFRKISSGSLEKGSPFSSFRYHLFEKEPKRLPGE